MVLIFLIILAFLAMAIFSEIERGQEIPASAAGVCPECCAAVEADWLLCPRCRTQIAESCSGCGRGTTRVHAFCPFCGQRKGTSP